MNIGECLFGLFLCGGIAGAVRRGLVQPNLGLKIHSLQNKNRTALAVLSLTRWMDKSRRLKISKNQTIAA